MYEEQLAYKNGLLSAYLVKCLFSRYIFVERIVFTLVELLNFSQ